MCKVQIPYLAQVIFEYLAKSSLDWSPGRGLVHTIGVTPLERYCFYVFL